MQSIVVKYTGPTGSIRTRGARYTATAYAGRVSLPVDHALSHQDNCIAAARALCEKLGWTGSYALGALPPAHKSEYVFVPMVKAFTVRGDK